METVDPVILEIEKPAAVYRNLEPAQLVEVVRPGPVDPHRHRRSLSRPCGRRRASSRHRRRGSDGSSDNVSAGCGTTGRRADARTNQGDDT